MTITIDPSILLNYYNSREGILTNASTTSSGTTSSSTAASTSTTPAAPTPPWNAANASTQANTLATQVLNGASVIPTNPAQLSVKGASTDYQSLFTAYQGLTALSGLVSDALATGPTATNAAQAAKALATGLTQVSNYVNGLSLQHVQLTSGTVQSTDATTAGPALNTNTYTTGVIFSGSLTDPVPAFAGNVQFNINITNYSGKQSTIPIDLSQMGDTPRTMPNVVTYLNSQLSAAGAVTRFATDGTPAAPETVTVGGQKVTLPAGLEQWALQINGDSTETVSFSAAATAPAVYVAQTSGDVAGYAAQTVAATSAADEAAITGVPVTPASSATTVDAPIQQLVKLQTDTSTTATAPPAAQVIPGTPGASPDEAFAQTLDPNVASVAATATGSDGSVYVLANVTGAVDGQTPQSSQNIALQKYDSAGNLIYSTILGSSGEASGLSLAVSADGQVAVAGAVTGALNPDSTGNGTSTEDSFVAVYNAQGEQQWTTTGLSPSNNQVNAVTFGADDSVYVAGQNNVTTATSAGYAPASGYVAGYSATGDSLFNVSTGTSNASGLAVSGNTVVVAGTTSSGDAQVNSYTLQTKGAPTLTATRDLGALGAGSIAGVAINNGQVVIAGTTTNGALSAGSVTSAFSGRQDAFVAQLSTNLSPSSSDAVAYYGGTGNTKATALTVSGGQVYIAGTSTGGLPGLTDQGTQEGFVANINVASGKVGWSQALDGQAGVDAPESIAVASGGASVLDRLGLPTQALNPAGSQLLTATTPVSAGDQFKIATSVGGTPATVTISADDTPQTLAQKIIAASGYQVTATMVPLNGIYQVQIKPQNSSQVIELLPGAPGLDALGSLGLSAGIIQTNPAVPAAPKVNPDRGAPKVDTTPTALPKDSYGLNIAQDFDLNTTAGLTAAQTAITKAIGTLQTAHNNLVNVTNPAPVSPTVTGSVPAYITAELANYQAGLSRLTGGSSSSSSTGTSSASVASSILT